MIPYRDDQGKLRFAPVTALAIFAWIGFWIWLVQSPPGVVRRIESTFGLRPDAWRELAGGVGRGAPGQVLGEIGQLVQPFLTYHFLHASIVHCASNALFFWVFGSRLEARSGSARFAAFLVLAGAIAGLAYVLTAPEPHDIGLGASGLVAASMAAYFVSYPRSRTMVLVPVIVVPVVVQLPSVILILMWVALQLRPISRLLEIGPAEPVAWSAHVAGALAGVALIPLLLRSRSRAPAPASR